MNYESKVTRLPSRIMYHASMYPRIRPLWIVCSLTIIEFELFFDLEINKIKKRIKKRRHIIYESKLTRMRAHYIMQTEDSLESLTRNDRCLLKNTDMTHHVRISCTMHHGHTHNIYAESLNIALLLMWNTRIQNNISSKHVLTLFSFWKLKIINISNEET